MLTGVAGRFGKFIPPMLRRLPVADGQGFARDPFGLPDAVLSMVSDVARNRVRSALPVNGNLRAVPIRDVA